MKKLTVVILILCCILCIAACDKQEPAPMMTNEIHTGEVTEISDTTITIVSNNKEIEFTITKLATLDMPANLEIGDMVMVETAYKVGTAEPFPAIRIANAEDNSIE